MYDCTAPYEADLGPACEIHGSIGIGLFRLRAYQPGNSCDGGQRKWYESEIAEGQVLVISKVALIWVDRIIKDRNFLSDVVPVIGAARSFEPLSVHREGVLIAPGT